MTLFIDQPILCRAMLVGLLLAVAHLPPPLSARPLYNVDDAKRDANAAEEIDNGQDFGTDLNTKTGNLELKEENVSMLDESDPGVFSDERNGKKYFQHQKGFGSHFYNFNRPYSNPRVIRPPVKFVSNGQPYNIVVNPREYLTSTTSTTEPTTSAPQTDSPLIWLTNTFFFNGRPTSVFSLPHNPWRSWPPVRGIPPSILQG